MENNGVNYIVSFPRSGHHVFIGFMDSLCGLGGDYCEFYNCTNHKGVAIDCRAADLKWRNKEFSCWAGKTNIKCHDFDLVLPYSPENRYLIQIRHPLYSISSWYELDKRKLVPHHWLERLLPEKMKFSFFEKKLAFWKAFYDKWIVSHGSEDNVFVLKYEQLAEPDHLLSAAEFLGYGDRVKKKVLKRTFFKPRRKQLELPAKYLRLEKDILDRLLAIGIPPAGETGSSG